jgi:hypothetical protein
MTIIINKIKTGWALTLLLFSGDRIYEKEVFCDNTYTLQMAVDWAIAEYAPTAYLTGEAQVKIIYN